MSDSDNAFDQLFNRMVFTPEQQERADRQGSNDPTRFLRHCKVDNDANCDHYDPLARMTPEERERI